VRDQACRDQVGARRRQPRGLRGGVHKAERLARACIRLCRIARPQTPQRLADAPCNADPASHWQLVPLGQELTAGSAKTPPQHARPQDKLAGPPAPAAVSYLSYVVVLAKQKSTV